MDQPRDHEPFFPPRLGDETLRGALGRAAVEVAGEVGYVDLTVGRILERGGVSRAVFYRLFDGRDSCYRRGYEELIEVLRARLLAECRGAGSWREALAAALAALAAALAAEPVLASGLIAQVRVAGGTAMEAHDRVAAALTAALERGREEAPRGGPPESAAAFVFGAIETAAIQALVRGEPKEFAARVPDLVHLATAIFLDRPGR
jgi:AcrR family transcriptional regulator